MAIKLVLQMDKSDIREALVARLNTMKLAAMRAATQARETATHSETVARSKYETFGLEASYLAHGQTQRVEEFARSQQAFSELTLREFDVNTAIALSAVVVILDEKDVEQTLFIGPSGGGVRFSVTSNAGTDVEIMVVTPVSPLGAALIGALVNDVVTISIADTIKTYEIIQVF
ncbi:transcription elongation factor [Shewanella colwelliana]|uniref:GreA/GreB family elongation factor n=1 Tax=Shewanella colwelliana TaxID=23 RepID=UPI001BC0773D|nr:transcription elongation factor [Shewanella colwelliana]GIU32417.1 transcription elongation factor [Shewanella colwelliana]